MSQYFCADCPTHILFFLSAVLILNEKVLSPANIHLAKNHTKQNTPTPVGNVFVYLGLKFKIAQ